LLDVADTPGKATVSSQRAAFAQRLRTLRATAGLTQTALAKAAGMDRSYYAEVEAGQHSVSIDRIFSIADALGVPAYLLFIDSQAGPGRQQGDTRERRPPRCQ
jgi:transcriptional regulator with XRE-family HTH domain